MAFDASSRPPYEAMSVKFSDRVCSSEPGTAMAMVTLVTKSRRLPCQ